MIAYLLYIISFYAGMNKLLQRLPDSSREEVRNQAIVLIQQLTSTNEEMKKTVVFNEVYTPLACTVIIMGTFLTFSLSIFCLQSRGSRSYLGSFNVKVDSRMLDS